MHPLSCFQCLKSIEMSGESGSMLYSVGDLPIHRWINYPDAERFFSRSK